MKLKNTTQNKMLLGGGIITAIVLVAVKLSSKENMPFLVFGGAVLGLLASPSIISAVLEPEPAKTSV